MTDNTKLEELRKVAEALGVEVPDVFGPGAVAEVSGPGRFAEKMFGLRARQIRELERRILKKMVSYPGLKMGILMDDQTRKRVQIIYVKHKKDKAG